ncbi:AMP-binding protein, partial [Streptomyces sp. NPDC094038]|uniref:AMP-binding protein n=1 Tax=Streptomyces sp. NPDC094038 TaxID=3366055 RepID=UPI003812F3C5
MIRTDLIRPLHELLRDHAGSRGGETAFSDACRAVTWAELERRTAWLAGHLASQGLERGERAALFLDNSVSMVEGYLALARVGAVGVPVGPHTTGAELTHMVGDAAIRLIVTDGPRLPVVTRMLAEYPDLLVVVTGDAVPEGALSFDDFATADPGVAPRDDLGLDDPAFLLYTSGTTGRPKGVLSTTRNSLWNIAACYTPVLGLSHGDEVLWPLPLSHCLGHHLGVLGVVATGASAYILNGFAPGEVLDLLARRPFTFLAAVPSMYQQLVYAAEGRAPVRNSLRMCFVAGSATTEALRTQVADVFGVPLTVGYGTTETCGLITSDWPDTARVPGSCGLPVTGLSVRLVDPQSSADVGQGAEGEVWVRGPGVMLGYWDGAAGAAVPPAEGWYRTGDLARADEAGYLTITGRIKELILRGGENIHPSEVEEVIARVPGVRDVAVFGAPHAVLGQMPVALVIPGPGGLDPAAVFAACRADLSYYKVPVQLHAVAEVPRTASGKIVRAALSDLPRRLLATATGRVEGVLRDSRPAAVTVDPRFDTAGTVLVTGPLAETVAHHLRLGHGFERVALYETPSPVAVIHTAEPATPVSYDGDPFVLTLVPIEEEGLANGANVTVAYDTEADLRTALDVALGAPDGRLVATTPAEAAALLDTDPSTEWSDTDDSPKAALAAELSALAPAERVDRMSAVVAAAAEKILAAPLSDLPFIDLGLTSSMAVALRNRLVTATGLRLPTALVFDYPTPSALATHLVELLCGPAKASARTSRRELPSTDPVVIVGMACRFPGGVEGPNDLWQLVSDSADAIGPFPLDRGWPGEFEGSFPRVGGFLYGAAEFDA